MESDLKWQNWMNDGSGKMWNDFVSKQVSFAYMRSNGEI